MFGGKRSAKSCGHTSSAPFKARCSKEAGHRGDHSARGLRWDSSGKIKFGGKGGTRK